MISLRNRYVLYLSVAGLFLIFLTCYQTGIENITPPISHILPTKAPAEPKPYRPRYKTSKSNQSLPIVDNFPLAAYAHSSADLPPIPIWNTPPVPHIKERTPLFIGFTRNWRILQQVVVSYITSGWPPEDIYVVENTGVMESNKKGLLSLQNPFFLNHTRLHVLGVNVVITPTLLTFAQLQNFYIWHATQRKWDHYFWSHMDLVAVSLENDYASIHSNIGPHHDYSDFVSLYANCVAALRSVLAPDAITGEKKRWAQRFFSYDRLALVNVEAFLEVGGWDTLIPFYMTDCDMHARLEMAGYVVEELPAGLIFDVGCSLEDLVVLYRHTGEGVPIVSWHDPNAVEAAAEKGGKERREESMGNDPLMELEGKVNESAHKSPSIASPNPPDSSSTWASRNSPSVSASTIPTPPTSLSSSSSSSSPYKPDYAHSPLFIDLHRVLDGMQGSKGSSSRGRNTWQSRQTGGQGDPFYRDSEGFEKGILMTIEFGRQVFAEKWGHRDCNIAPIGMKASDAWNVDHDWEPPKKEQ
jgi:hypothetical protein